MMVVDTIEEVAPGVVEVDEYIVEAGNISGESLAKSAPGMPGGPEEE